jgi:hypothetical protein
MVRIQNDGLLHLFPWVVTFLHSVRDEDGRGAVINVIIRPWSALADMFSAPLILRSDA